MGEQSPSEILKHVAVDLRSLPETFRERSGGKASRKTGFSVNAPGGRLVARAIEAGAFSEPKYVLLRTCFEQAKERDPTRWEGTFWVDACMHLLPEVALDPHKMDLQSEAVFSAIADLIEREAARLEESPEAGAGAPEAKPLTESQQEAFDYIKDHGPLTGKEIVNRLGISCESNFTAHYVPALKRHGIKNRRGLGYYHPDCYRPDSDPPTLGG